MVFNREFRKKYNKEHKTKYTKEDFERMYLEYQELVVRTGGIQGQYVRDFKTLFPDGIRCKLNYEAIISRPQHNLTKEFKEWVERNKETEFIIERDESNERNGFVCLGGNDDVYMKDNIKWLFNVVTDLIVWNEEQCVWEHPEDILELLDVKKQVASVISQFLRSDMNEEDKEEIYNWIDQVNKSGSKEQCDEIFGNCIKKYNYKEYKCLYMKNDDDEKILNVLEELKESNGRK